MTLPPGHLMTVPGDPFFVLDAIMPIDVRCSECSTKLRAPDTAAGKKIKCPKCQTIIPVPAPESEEAAVAPVDREPDPTPAEEDEVLVAPRRRPEPEGDRPPRRAPQRDTSQAESSGTAPLILGIVSIVLALVAMPLAFMGCCPPIAFISAGLAAVALLLGGGGTVLAFVSKKGLPCPLIGTALSLVGMGIVVAWGVIWGGF
jgi:phage FluMu protein Com